MLLLATVAFGVPLALSLSARVRDEVRTQALDQATLVAATARDLLGVARRPALRTLAAAASASLRGRVLIVDRAGRVLADSAGPADLGASYASRPEFGRALGGSTDQVQRYSQTLREEILATAVPIVRDGETAGAVRVTQSAESVRHAVRTVVLGVVVIGAVVLLVGLLVGSVLAGQIGRPLGRLEQVARRLAQGELGARAPVEGGREQRSLARSFNEMADRIGRLVRAQRDFVADASHQLRTPLTGLRLRLEAAGAATADASVSHELDQALAEVDRLAEMVSELLLLSRAGERGLTGTTVELAEIVAAAARRWEAEATARRLTLAAATEGDPGSVWIAREDIDRALDALVENAVHYAPPGTPIELVAGPRRIEVRDRGPGVEPAEGELVFDRFRRGSAGRVGPPGHGLGLPIARELTRAWGGEVTLEPRAGGGTRAVLALAAAEAAPRSGEPGGALPAVNPGAARLP